MSTDDEIVHFGNGGVVFAGPNAVDVFRAASLSAAIGLLSKGIAPGRGWTMKKALAMCQPYTGRSYKRTEHEQARADLKVWIETMKSTIPTVIRGST